MHILYNIGISFLSIFIKILSPFGSEKFKFFVKGRDGLLQKIEDDLDNYHNRLDEKDAEESNLIWFHCSSMGEFEQARPVIERFKENEPNTKIVLTFFSPSGYEIRKNYDKADWVYYLPIDTPSNARQFIKAIKPQKVFFTKYDLWYNHIMAAKKWGSKIYLISAIFRNNQPFFKWWGGFFRKMLKQFDIIFVQDTQSVKNLNSIGIKENVFVAGDTRFDRVVRIASNSGDYKEIKDFKGDYFTIVAGSTWSPDENILRNVMERLDNIKLIIAPHEVNPERIEKVEQTFKQFGVVRYSNIAKEKGKEGERVLLIDCIGILSALYKYANFSYIGGGFGIGIHNTLEAAVYGSPIAFGPKYQKFNEAINLIGNGGAVSIENSDQLYSIVNKCFTDRDICTNIGHNSLQYVNSQVGATDIIMNKIG